MFRRLFGREKQPATRKDDISTPFPTRVEIRYSGNEVTVPDQPPRPPYATMQESDWEDYERFWEWGKEDYDNRETWRKVRRVVHQYERLTFLMDQAYYRREVDGFVPAIELCKQIIAISHMAVQALPLDHDIEQDFLRWECRKWGIPEREPWPFKMPENRGFKQLAITRYKERDFEAAIDVCDHAMRVGWPGDWDVRIARCKRRLDNTS